MKNKLIPKHQTGEELNKLDSLLLLQRKPDYVDVDITDDEFFDWFNFKKDTSDVSDYFNSYLNSEGLKRILNNQEQWWIKRHPYRKLYSNFDQGTTEWLNAAKKVEPFRYTASMYTDLSESVHIPALGKQRFIIVGTENVPSYLTESGTEYDPIHALGHEYAHGKTPFDIFGAALFNKRSAQAEVLNQNTNTQPGHDSRQLEKHADIWGLKYLLYKEGIYDSRSDEDITIEQVEELRKKYPNLRPFKQMNNEQLRFQLNHVAQNNINNINNNYAKV